MKDKTTKKIKSSNLTKIARTIQNVPLEHFELPKLLIS